MLFELHGASFHNKGAQLMLETVIRQVTQRLPEAGFCIEWDHSVVPNELQRLRLKTFFLAAPRGNPRRYPVLSAMSRMAGRIAPKTLLRSHNLVARHAADALLDISGYAFGEKMSLSRTKAFASRARYYSRRRRPVVMLPQMFGPFHSRQFRDGMRAVYEAADLLYARDQISFASVRDLCQSGCNKLRLAPDITIFSEPGVEMTIPSKAYACIVPNIQLLRKGDVRWQECYLSDLTKATRMLNGHDLMVKLVVHETSGDDRRLAHRILDKADKSRVSIFESECPFRLKAVLGGARFVVASRFHAVVGALSLGVPTIVLGWAHKYEMLTSDFGSSAYMHRVDDGWEGLESKIYRLLDSEVHAAVQSSLRMNKERMRQSNSQMWSEVFDTLHI